MTPGVMEGDLPTERVVGDSDTRIIFKMDGILTRAMDRMADRIQIMFSRRHSYGEPQGEWEKRLRELEGQIDDIARDHDPGVHIVNHPRPPRHESWQNKILVGVAILVIASAICGAVVTWASVESLKTLIEAYMTSNNQRLDRDEHQMDDTQRRLDRGAVMP